MVKTPAEKKGAAARATRPEAARTGPIRGGLGGAKRAREAPDSAEHHQPPPNVDPAATPDLQTIIRDAVRLGYEVLEKNREHGLRAVERFKDRKYGGDDMADDIRALGERVGDLTGALGKVWFELLLALIREVRPNDNRGPEASHPDSNSAAAAPGSANSEARAQPHGKAVVFCDVQDNPRAVGADFELQRPEKPTHLMVLGLHSPSSKEPLTNVQFLATADGAHVRAVVTVPPGHPPGVYSGAVLDWASHMPLGTITVQVAE